MGSPTNAILTLKKFSMNSMRVYPLFAQTMTLRFTPYSGVCAVSRLSNLKHSAICCYSANIDPRCTRIQWRTASEPTSHGGHRDIDTLSLVTLPSGRTEYALDAEIRSRHVTGLQAPCWRRSAVERQWT